MPLHSMLRMSHNKLTAPFLTNTQSPRTHCADSKHQWCGWLTPMVWTVISPTITKHKEAFRPRKNIKKYRGLHHKEL